MPQLHTTSRTHFRVLTTRGSESVSYRASFEGKPLEGLEWLQWSLLSGIFVNFICRYQNLERHVKEKGTPRAARKQGLDPD